MKKFEFFEWATADVCYKAYGTSWEEVFSNAALAMFEVMVRTEQVKPLVERKIMVKAATLERLLFNWLNELLLYVDSESLLFSRFDIKLRKNEKIKLMALCKGEKADPERHELRSEVKACSYHELKLSSNKKRWAQVLLDI